MELDNPRTFSHRFPLHYVLNPFQHDSLLGVTLSSGEHSVALFTSDDLAEQYAKGEGAANARIGIIRDALEFAVMLTRMKLAGWVWVAFDPLPRVTFVKYLFRVNDLLAELRDLAHE